MKRYNINIKNTYRIDECEEINMVEDIMMEVVDQLIGQGMSDTDVQDAIKFAMDNIF